MKELKNSQKKKLHEYIAEAIRDNYLLTILISSYTQAKYKTLNLPFGLGKSTLAFDLSYLLHGENWDKTFRNACYNPFKFGELLAPIDKPEDRKTCIIFDDVQATCPASQSVPKAVRKLASYITTNRPEVPVIIFTAPNINMISAPLRKLVNFEIIIAKRGFYEVHKISYNKNFSKPLEDLMNFKYVEELKASTPFPPFPPDIQRRYDLWRAEEKRALYPSLMKDLQCYTDLRSWENEGGDIETELKCTKGAHGYVLSGVHEDLAEKIHNKTVRVTISSQ